MLLTLYIHIISPKYNSFSNNIIYIKLIYFNINIKWGICTTILLIKLLLFFSNIYLRLYSDHLYISFSPNTPHSQSNKVFRLIYIDYTLNLTKLFNAWATLPSYITCVQHTFQSCSKWVCVCACVCVWWKKQQMLLTQLWTTFKLLENDSLCGCGIANLKCGWPKKKNKKNQKREL